MVYDEEFIKPEVRAGWQVDTPMKKVWYIQILILEEMRRICEKHNLRYFVICGALLGAVRHKGYIPWDDDIDLGMPREDWNRFIEVAKTEVKEPYFLQTPLTDVDCYQTWVSLRRSDTTGNRISCLKTRQNNGIGIDICVLDGCEDDIGKFGRRRYPLYVLSTIANTYVNEFNTTPKANALRRVLRLFPINYRKIWVYLQSKLSGYTWDKFNCVAMTLLADPLTKDLRHIVWRKEDFSSAVELPFEFTTIPAPVGYDRVLATTYGDYMTFPPVDKRVGKHKMIFEPDVPYRQYCSENYGVVY